MSTRMLNQVNTARKATKENDNAIIYLSAVLCERIERFENKIACCDTINAMGDFQEIFYLKGKLKSLILDAI